MPNWCSNSLKIEGTAKELKKFKKKLDIENFLGSFIPIPPELVNRQSPSKTTNTINPTKEEMKENIEKIKLIKLYGVENWYDWSIKNWGTKWDMNEVYDPESNKDIENADDDEYQTLEYSFESPWSPPIQGLENISKLYPQHIPPLDSSSTCNKGSRC